MISLYIFWRKHIGEPLWKGKYLIDVSEHAFIRAKQRGIHSDLIDDTIQHGKMRRFGKNRVKFEKRFRKFTIICVDEIVGNAIRIVTIEKKV